MSSATNVHATAVNTMQWLSTTATAIVVPVYQRQYRWDIGSCEQLLADIRAVASSDDHAMHFLGSVLSSTSSDADGTHLVLIDGQQRITTLMLLVAALHHTVRADDPELAAQLERVLVHEAHPNRTRLRPHRAWAGLFEDVVLDRRTGERDSRFDENYAFFRSRLAGAEAPVIWRGLQKLEHVAITLGAGAHAQQIFESLNSTGEPLRDHELIHNYVLMGLSPVEQARIEDEYWLPIERSTGSAIGSFWRHYLMQSSGREIDVDLGRRVYDSFRALYPQWDEAELHVVGRQWRDAARVYAVLLDPDTEPDPEVAAELRGLATFGRTAHPVSLRLYLDAVAGVRTRAELLSSLRLVQSMLLRRAVVGMSIDRLSARLCRALELGNDAFIRAIARITPSDARVRVALKFGELPHASTVLSRMSGLDRAEGFVLDHILPAAPGDSWSGGTRVWSELSEDEQNAHRAIAGTIGNLVLLEEDIADRAFDRDFTIKRDAYRRSILPMTSAVSEHDGWDTARIAARTAELTALFLTLWPRPDVGEIDDDGLTPILDAKERRGFPPGWEREWDYVEYCGEHWEVKDVRYLFHRVFARLWADHRDAVLSFNARRGGPIYTEQAWSGHWAPLDEGHVLYMGWDSRYMLAAVQGVLHEAGLAPDVFVKYSYIGDVM